MTSLNAIARRPLAAVPRLVRGAAAAGSRRVQPARRGRAVAWLTALAVVFAVVLPVAAANQAPSRTLSGASTLFNNPSGIALDASGNTYVSNWNSSANRVVVFAPFANGNVAPTRTIQGAATTLNQPRGIAFDSAGNVYVANEGGNSVAVFLPTDSGNVAPSRSIFGANTGLRACLKTKILIFS